MIQCKRRCFLLSKLIFTVLIGSMSFLSYAQVTIDIKQSQIKLIYPQAVRFSQVLQDAQQSLNYLPYTLGISLINQDRHEEINTLEHNILSDLGDINTPPANQLKKQLQSLHFAYRETLETDPVKIAVMPKLNPLLSQNYALSLPKRPDHVLLVDSDTTAIRKVKLKANHDLTSYLTELDSRSPDSVWIIQANQDVYQATNILWQDKLYYLSPGAIIFTGLKELPKQYQGLNARIAHLLAFHMDF